MDLIQAPCCLATQMENGIWYDFTTIQISEDQEEEEMQKKNRGQEVQRGT
jgi:hypothetical protein